MKKRLGPPLPPPSSPPSGIVLIRIVIHYSVCVCVLAQSDKQAEVRSHIYFFYGENFVLFVFALRLHQEYAMPTKKQCFLNNFYIFYGTEDITKSLLQSLIGS